MRLTFLFSEIGYFEGAIRPNVDSFRGSVKSMNEICKDVPRDQEVFMYCTGKFDMHCHGRSPINHSNIRWYSMQ